MSCSHLAVNGSCSLNGFRVEIMGVKTLGTIVALPLKWGWVFPKNLPLMLMCYCAKFTGCVVTSPLAEFYPRGELIPSGMECSEVDHF